MTDIVDPRTPEQNMIHREQWALVEEALNCLDPYEELVIRLLYLDEFAYSEVAEIAGCDVMQIIDLHDRALAKLQEKLV